VIAALALVVATATTLVACGGHTIASATAPAKTQPATTGASTAQVPTGDWLEFDYDAQRSGVGPGDTGITAANLGSLQTRVVHVDGTVDSSAVEVAGVAVHGRARDVIVVTTTYGKTIAIDPATGQRLWEFTPADIGSYVGSGQVTTASPIVDPDRRYVYAASADGFIHKLALASGHQLWSTRVTFDPTREKIASALNISGGQVVVTTGGYYGDAPTYQGHVVTIDRGSGRILHVWNALCSNRHHLIDPPRSCPAGDAAIWARAGAVIEPGSGRILVATGNGPFNGSTNWGDSVLELTPDASRLLHNWTPTDQAQLNASDGDLGSSAPALLPELGGDRLAVQGAKDGQLHLLNLGRLDGTQGGAGPRLGGEVEDISSPGGDQVYTAPAVWSHNGRPYVFVADNSGTAAYTVRIAGGPRLAAVWRNGNAGTSPVLAGGLLYVYDLQGAMLDVYAPASGRLLRSLPAAHGHWNSPIVVGGRIVLPVGNYMDHATGDEIFIYHLPGR
jgi:outer membrane protein assembly factor BamB